MSQLLKVLPQSNIASTNVGGITGVWLLDRYNAGWIWYNLANITDDKSAIFHRYAVPIVNQTGTSGYITSPNYPNSYGNWSLCDYYITAPPNNTVRIFIILSKLKKENLYC